VARIVRYVAERLDKILLAAGWRQQYTLEMAYPIRSSSASLSRILSSALRVLIAVAAILALLWWFGVRMPGKNISRPAPLSSDELAWREESRPYVQKLAGTLGERNMGHYPEPNAAANFIEDAFSRAGLHPRRDSYEIRGQTCHNIEAEIPGRPRGATAS